MVHRQEGRSSPVRPPSLPFQFSATEHDGVIAYSLPPKIPADREMPLLLPKLYSRPKPNLFEYQLDNSFVLPTKCSRLSFNKVKKTIKKLVKSKSHQDIHRLAVLEERNALINRKRNPHPNIEVLLGASPLATTTQSNVAVAAQIPVGSTVLSHWGRADRLRSRSYDLSKPSNYYHSTSDLASNSSSDSNMSISITIPEQDSGPAFSAPADRAAHTHTLVTQSPCGNNSSLLDCPNLLVDFEALMNDFDGDVSTWPPNAFNDDEELL